MFGKFFVFSTIFSIVFFCSGVKTDAADDDDVIDDLSDDDVAKETASESVVFHPEEFVTPDAPVNSYFAEFFKDEKCINKWMKSKAQKDGTDSGYTGEWKVSLPNNVVLNNDYVLVAESKAHHHAISSKLTRPFNFKANKPLIVQYDVQFQNGLDCGGAYIKLLSDENLNLEKFNDKTPYTIMFGPDKCGMTAKVHFIVRFKNPSSGNINEHHAKHTDKSLDSYFTDKKSHLYTLELNPDGKYKVYVDQSEITSGNIKDNLEPNIVPPKEIDDPNDKKPETWDDREKIPDPDGKKPEDWDENAPEKIADTNAKKPDDWLEDEPEYVPNQDAKKPDDWDEEMDGKWEPPQIKNPKCSTGSGCGKWTPPMIKNPDFKGKWKAPMINNPAYQGKWAPRKIQNPEYFEVPIYPSLTTGLAPIGAVGLELWTMTAGIAFDNFLIVDEKPVADSIAAKTWYIKNTAEGRSASKSSIFTNLIQTANDKPWLWAVYLLVILIPIILITIFCFSGGSKDEAAEAKKTDKTRPDDVSGVNQDDQNEAELVGGSSDNEEIDNSATPVADTSGKSIKSEKTGSSSPKKPTKADLEENSDSDANEQKPSKSSPRRRAARKE